MKVNGKYLIRGDINKTVYKKLADFLFLLYASKREIGEFCFNNIGIRVEKKQISVEALLVFYFLDAGRFLDFL